ncbi:MAG: hypothetical protein IKP86_09830, partial [Anaerolineaceae bacterium]|nr:hypothetical protein [Anaerolineaceae bacterium]
GYGYYAFIQNENISALSLPFYLKEDSSFPDPGPVSVNEDITASIKETGGGRCQLRSNNDLYFSASDNHPEDHEYSVLSPVIIRNRWLLAIFAVTALVLAADLVIFLRHRESGMFRTLIRTLTVSAALLLLIPWNRLIFSSVPSAFGGIFVKPVLQRNTVFLVLFLTLAALNILLNGRNRILSGIAVLVVLVNSVYYFIPEWDHYGMRADSPAYLQKYSASSIRTPGYPLFIETVFTLSGKTGELQTIRAENENVSDENLRNGKTTESRGLLDVVRVQKCALGISFLILFAVWCRFYDPAGFMAAAQIILCAGFLGVDNSYIMTECLSQAALLLIASLIILIVKEKRLLFFPLLCVISAVSILIRPANIFLVLPLAVCGIILLRSGRNIWTLLAGCVMFFALCAVPAVNIYKEYGIFVWMPTSGYVEIARAVEIMQPGDEENFEDPEMKEFCEKLLKLKEQYPDADQNTNMWQVGITAAREQGYDLITCSPLLGKFSRRIFRLRFSEFLNALFGNIKTALERTRLQTGRISFPVLFLFFSVLFVLRPGTDTLLGFGFSLLHVIHLVLSMMNQPERRYIYSTEILCLLGWLMILCGVLRSLSGSIQDRQRSD